MVGYYRFIVVVISGFLCISCPVNSEDAMMWKLYNQWHNSIFIAVNGTDITEEYMAAIISLESHPPGNPDSKRFEPKIYERLIDLRDHNRSFGFIKRSSVKNLSDDSLKDYATSHGLTQIMGFHCFKLGCTIEELGSKDHLIWAIGYMQMSYSKSAKQKDWPSCFRIHNTGTKTGKTSRNDYVERGMIRMKYYSKWMSKDGKIGL